VAPPRLLSRAKNSHINQGKSIKKGKSRTFILHRVLDGLYLIQKNLEHLFSQYGFESAPP
jgi:hypothetical protein